MKKKPIRFSTIGAFVTGGLALIIGGVIFLGSGEIFKSSREFVLIFDQSVNGLSIGAPVKFRGVQVGLVRAIRLHHQKSVEFPQIAVLIGVHSAEQGSRVGETLSLSDPALLETLIDKGLRAQLRSQSVLSGELYVSLDMLPDEPLEYQLASSPNYLEIPTAKSGLMEDLTANSANLTRSLSGALENLQVVLMNINKKLDPVSDESIQTLQAVRAAMTHVGELLDPQAPIGQQIPKSLQEIEEAAKAIRLLAEYLERHPNSVLFGRSRVEVVERK
ncbi:MAG: MCE family protein [Bradymonadales bacterium]|nr:MAG: MCE family protein [Bradymonadales bacterium]